MMGASIARNLERDVMKDQVNQLIKIVPILKDVGKKEDNQKENLSIVIVISMRGKGKDFSVMDTEDYTK